MPKQNQQTILIDSEFTLVSFRTLNKHTNNTPWSELVTSVLLFIFIHQNIFIFVLLESKIWMWLFSLAYITIYFMVMVPTTATNFCVYPMLLMYLMFPFLLQYSKGNDVKFESSERIRWYSVSLFSSDWNILQRSVMLDAWSHFLINHSRKLTMMKWAT